MEGTREIPLFPLGQVLFLGGSMSLRIFEPRYVDMVSRCMREDSGFGVVLIREGRDTWAGNDAGHPDIFNIGTFARIVDFDSSQGGLFNIKIQGE
ncbi:MAG: LON peptidase substrate-binding domain-containing protein, partial [Gammaproteobacteria bacterium]|nr:LON peptidase substrate-binding domain-containing protein [Gammaproteobacteria bacterium]